MSDVICVRSSRNWTSKPFFCKLAYLVYLNFLNKSCTEMPYLNIWIRLFHKFSLELWSFKVLSQIVPNGNVSKERGNKILNSSVPNRLHNVSVEYVSRFATFRKTFSNLQIHKTITNFESRIYKHFLVIDLIYWNKCEIIPLI